MSRKSVMKKCNRGCNTDIYLSDETGKWLPYNQNNTLHECMKQQDTTTATNREAKIAAIVETIRSIVKELEALK